MMLSGLKLFTVITAYLIVICTLSLLLLTWTMLMKLVGLLKRIPVLESSVQYILCLLGVGTKNIKKMPSELQLSQWSGDGDIRPGFTSTSSVTPGEPKATTAQPKVVKQWTDEEIDAMRKSGI